jgi:RNA polymerase sigma-70 factor (ECF subfamily)
LLIRLRAGDESAFADLVSQYHPAMVRLALLHVRSRAVAEEVAQEAWLGLLRGLEGFEGRSSLRTWIFRILTNIAKTRGQREARSAPFSSVWAAGDDEPVVDLDRFREDGGWARAPDPWSTEPEQRLLSHETLAEIGRAIDRLPANQREVIRLRDVLGWSSPEVCNALGITETNQRVLLHRARAKVRRSLEAYLAGGESGPEGSPT